jgi:hypothetical protein
MNYVRMFYTAMSKFVRKHYGGSRAGFFNFLVHMGIWFRAALTATGNFIRQIGLPLMDAGLILLSFWLVKNSWNEYVKTDTLYENKLLWIAFPAFTLFYLITAYYAGLYDRWYKRTELIRSTLIATIVLLAAYALLPEQYRFSRAIILFGAFLAFIFISVLRWILVRTGILNSSKEKEERFTTLIAGSPEEYEQAIALLKEAGLQQKVLGRIAVTPDDKEAIGSWGEMKKLSNILPFSEMIICRGKLSYKEIIDGIQQLPSDNTIKIYAAGSGSIVGSNSKDVSGEAVSKENGFRLANPYNRRLKRLIDISVSLAAIISFPLHLFLVKKPISFFGNCFSVLMAGKTWVGYTTPSKNLPSLRKGVIASNGVLLTENTTRTACK